MAGEKLLIAVGRKIDLSELGVGVLGIDESLRTLPVDDRLKVADGVWALGDLVGKGAFTHISMYHSAIVIREILGQPGPAADYRALPHVTFTDPEIGSVGLNEAQARDAGLNVRVGFTSVALVNPRLDPQGRRAHQAGRGRRPRRAGGSHQRRARSAEKCSAAWSWPCTPRCRPTR